MATTARKTSTKKTAATLDDVLAAIQTLDARFTEVINSGGVGVDDVEDVEDDEEGEVELTREMVE